MIRAAALATALLLAAGLAPFAAAGPTSKEDVQEAAQTLKELEDQLEDAEARLAELDRELVIAATEVDRAEGSLAQTISDLFSIRRRIKDNRHRFKKIEVRLNERAVEAFIGGPASDLDFLLGATSLADLSDRLAFTDAIAQDDAELAQEVANVRNQLREDERALEDLRAQRREDLKQAEKNSKRVADLFAEAQDLLAYVESKKAEARENFLDTKKAYDEWQKELAERREAAANASAAPSYGNVPLPSGYANVLKVCPVGAPNGFGDGFGAPRYAGGYHLHKGVDIVAPAGTPIYAPFDGYAQASSNTLGGLVVFVTASAGYGRVYNAHLSAYSDKSNGPVSAGDVIGYVGDTGDATGINHDHFEFHPAVMPSSWPVSYYGYSIIEDAVNPYPLLLNTCR